MNLRGFKGRQRRRVVAHACTHAVWPVGCRLRISRRLRQSLADSIASNLSSFLHCPASTHTAHGGCVCGTARAGIAGKMAPSVSSEGAASTAPSVKPGPGRYVALCVSSFWQNGSVWLCFVIIPAHYLIYIEICVLLQNILMIHPKGMAT